jgi:hypothetical protein
MFLVITNARLILQSMLKRSATNKRPSTKARTLGAILTPRLSHHGDTTRLAQEIGVSVSYLSRISHDQVWSLSEPVKRAVATALRMTAAEVSEALRATEAKAARVQQHSNKGL